MGWTWYNITDTTTQGIKEELRSQWEVGNNGRYKVLQDATIHNTWYAAIQNTETNNVFAVVYLYKTDRKDYYNFGYKDMDETMHPYCYEAPKSLLDLLTPTTNEEANSWRNNCYKHLEEKKEGQKNNKLLEAATVISFVIPHSYYRYYNEGETVVLTKTNWYGKTIWLDRRLRIKWPKTMINKIQDINFNVDVQA